MGLKPHEYFNIIYDIGHDISILLDMTRVSRSGYYKWIKRKDLPDKDLVDYKMIKQIFDKFHSKAGFRTVKMKLSSEFGIVMNHKKVLRIKEKYGLVTKIRRPNPYKKIFKATKEHRISSNVLDRGFKQNTPYEFFCTDITYLYFRGYPTYLSVMKDIASGEIISWELSRHVDMDLVVNTITNMENTLKERGINLENILIHSDQGSTYTSPVFRSALSNLKMIQSMSRRGNCIDNAPIESFFGHLKDDIDYKICTTFSELKEVVSEYIEYYNTGRQQWALKKMTPVDYRDHLLNVL